MPMPIRILLPHPACLNEGEIERAVRHPRSARPCSTTPSPRSSMPATELRLRPATWWCARASPRCPARWTEMRPAGPRVGQAHLAPVVPGPGVKRSDVMPEPKARFKKPRPVGAGAVRKDEPYAEEDSDGCLPAVEVSSSMPRAGRLRRPPPRGRGGVEEVQHLPVVVHARGGLSPASLDSISRPLQIDNDLMAAGPLVIITMRSDSSTALVDIVRPHHHSGAGTGATIFAQLVPAAWRG